MKKTLTLLIAVTLFLAACSNTNEISIEGNWISADGDEMYISSTDIFDGGFAMSYKIKSKTELLIVDVNGNEQTIEYSIKDDVLTLKSGQSGKVYYRQD